MVWIRSPHNTITTGNIYLFQSLIKPVRAIADTGANPSWDHGQASTERQNAALRDASNSGVRPEPDKQAENRQKHLLHYVPRNARQTASQTFQVLTLHPGYPRHVPRRPDEHPGIDCYC